MAIDGRSAAGDGWSAIRVSHGLCGIIIMDKDVPTVADYLEEHQVRLQSKGTVEICTYCMAAAALMHAWHRDTI